MKRELYKPLTLATLPFEFEQLVNTDSITSQMDYSVFVGKTQFSIINSSTEKTYNFPKHNTYNKDHNLPFEIRYASQVPFEEIEGKTYLIQFSPVKRAALSLKSRVEVEAIGEQSDLLQLNIKGESIELSENILNTLIDLFNKDGIKDRQLVSKRTLDFIDERFDLFGTRFRFH